MDILKKYARQTALEGFGVAAQKSISESKVVLAGVGGVGCAALPLLAGAGFGGISIVDFDTVSEGNLFRQTIYRADSVGLSKARLAADYAKALNPDIDVSFFCGAFEGETAAAAMRGAALCIDATDTFKSRIEVARICRGAGLREIAASAEGFVSQNFLFGEGFYFDDVSSFPPSAARPAAVFGPAAHLSGVWAAAAAIRFAACGAFDTGMFYMFDHSSMKYFSANIR